MRISDWSSDVCSSDLDHRIVLGDDLLPWNVEHLLHHVHLAPDAVEDRHDEVEPRLRRMGVTAEALDRIGIALLDRSQRPDQEDQRQYPQRNREIHRIPLRLSLSPPIASLLRQWPRRATEKRTTPIDPPPRSLLYVPASPPCPLHKASGRA